MGKKEKLYHLRLDISENAIRAKYLLENAIHKSDSERETFIFGDMALELVNKIATKSEKIGRILKH